jgi:4-methylaminobutanoate oxidase (formaldehyde-forming)
VRVGDGPIGRVTSGGYGHRVGRSIAYAYLPRDVEPGQRVEVGVFGRWRGAEVAQEPLYDPQNVRPRGDAAVTVGS